jgi:hypothetical protein
MPDGWRSWLWRLLAASAWTLVVCYPDPRVLWESMHHAWHPPVDAEAVRDWARTLPDDPRAIERAVLARIEYAVPWQVDGVPWTFASPGQALAAGYGDCQARAVVFASVLAAKGIPFQLRASFDHMWVEYKGKQATTLENASKTLWARPASALTSRASSRGRDAAGAAAGAADAASGPAAGLRLRLPAVDWAESFAIEREYFWDPAPLSRKLLIFSGCLMIWLWPEGLFGGFRRPRSRSLVSVMT